MAAILSQYSTTGFYMAPASKGILGCMLVSSCALNVPLLAHLKKYFSYTAADVFDKFEIWRLITSKATFLDTKVLVCGSLLVYYFRIFERRYGSRKFSSLLFATCITATLLELVTVACLKHLKSDLLLQQTFNGPFALIFPLFINYFCDIPRVAQTHILGIPVTGKTLTYLIGLQMLTVSKSSAISGICGLIAGLLVRYNVLRVQNIFAIPSFVAKSADVALGWILKSSPPQENQLPTGATIEIQRQQQMEILEQQMLLNRARQFRTRTSSGRQQMGQGYSEQLVASGPVNFNSNHYNMDGMEVRYRPGEANGAGGDTAAADASSSSAVQQEQQPIREDQVQTLVEMGFERQNVLEALRSSNNDINIATNLLLHDS